MKVRVSACLRNVFYRAKDTLRSEPILQRVPFEEERPAIFVEEMHSFCCLSSFS